VIPDEQDATSRGAPPGSGYRSGELICSSSFWEWRNVWVKAFFAAENTEPIEKKSLKTLWTLWLTHSVSPSRLFDAPVKRQNFAIMTSFLNMGAPSDE
jgi:hypothetical protein